MCADIRRIKCADLRIIAHLILDFFGACAEAKRKTRTAELEKGRLNNLEQIKITALHKVKGRTR